MILYNKDKWLDIWKNSKYEEIRNKILSSFNELRFVEDGHRYFVGDRELECVSNVTHIFKPHVDVDELAEATFKRRFNDANSKYYQMTKEEILKEWKKINNEACNMGTERHEFGESCFYYMTGQYDKILPTFKDRLREDGGFESTNGREDAVVKFFSDLPRCVVPILAETKVYVVEKEYAYAGTFDILFYYDATLDGKDDSKSGLFVMDYKTNKDLYKNFNNERLLKPFEGLLNMNVSLYKLQLSLYQMALENIGLKIVARRLLWLKDTGKYDKVNLESYTNVLREELPKHWFQLKK